MPISLPNTHLVLASNQELLKKWCTSIFRAKNILHSKFFFYSRKNIFKWKILDSNRKRFGKVHIFWGGHKILKKSPNFLVFDITYSDLDLFSNEVFLILSSFNISASKMIRKLHFSFKFLEQPRTKNFVA